MNELNSPGAELLPYPLQRYLIRNLTTLAEQAGNAELLQLWAGQSANLARHKHAADLVQELATGLPN
jgi:nitronate monooxygenase